MRKLLLGILVCLFNAHAMAVGKECEGIEEHVKLYEVFWMTAAADNEDRLLRVFPQHIVDMWISGRKGIGNKYTTLEKLNKEEYRDLLEEAGINRLYDRDSFKELRDAIINNDKIPDVNSQVALANYLNMRKSTVISWTYGRYKNIAYEGQLRLNYVAQKHGFIPRAERPALEGALGFQAEAAAANLMPPAMARPQALMTPDVLNRVLDFDPQVRYAEGRLLPPEDYVPDDAPGPSWRY